MKTADKELQKALSSFKKKYPKSDSGDLQTFILGWRAMEEYANQPAVSEEEIKKASAKHEAAARADSPDISSDDWYFDYVNEDFEAGAKWLQSLNVQGDNAQQGREITEDEVKAEFNSLVSTVTLSNYLKELESYIDFIGLELDELAILANTHGWKSSRVKEGEDRRVKLKASRRAAGLKEGDKP